ncbi:MAG: DUF6259 domain-containing protein [Anaerolineae bacterium]
MPIVSVGELALEFDDRGLLGGIRGADGFQTCPHHSLWRLVLHDRAGRPWSVTAHDGCTCEIVAVGEGVRLTWGEIEAAPGIVVRAEFTPWPPLQPSSVATGEEVREGAWGEGLACWLTVDGLRPDAALWQADFPVLPALCLSGQENEARVLVPKAGGQVIGNLAQARLSELDADAGTFSYPCDLTMQFVACYYEDGDGLLVMAQDPNGWYKQFTLRREQGHRLALAVAHFPAGMPLSAGCFSPPYPVVLSVFEGGWTGAAERYRTWAICQPWCGRGPLHARRDIPAWLPANGLWVWNRGPSRVVLPGARRIQEVVAAPVALDWYWWHHTPYDTHFPDYLPPREGGEAFRKAVDDLHAAGLRAIVYINGRLWGTRAPSWQAKGAERAACRRADGDIYRELYCIFDPAEAEVTPMCPATDLWQSTVAELVRDILAYGLDGVYLDQIAHTEPELCYDATHGHPAGGGTHWRDGYRALMQRVRSAAGAHPETILLTEGACEAYLDLFDAFLVLDNSYERLGFYSKLDLNWESVPLFAAVYHDYALHFGSYASLASPPYDDLWPQPAGPAHSPRFRERDFAAAFYAELGRAFVAGAQPMVSNVYLDELEDPDLEPQWRFLRDLVQTRLHAADFLVYGTWRPPPRLDVPEIAVDFLVRGIYTPPEREHVVQRRLPAVLAALWAAPDGRLGLALANIGADAQQIAWHSEDVVGGQQTYLIDGNGRTPLGRVGDDGLIFEGVIPGRSVRVIEVMRYDS